MLAHPWAQTMGACRSHTTSPHCQTNLSPCLEHTHLEESGASYAPHVQEMAVCHDIPGGCDCVEFCLSEIFSIAEALSCQLYSGLVAVLFYTSQPPPNALLNREGRDTAGGGRWGG